MLSVHDLPSGGVQVSLRSSGSWHVLEERTLRSLFQAPQDLYEPEERKHSALLEEDPVLNAEERVESTSKPSVPCRHNRS